MNLSSRIQRFIRKMRYENISSLGVSGQKIYLHLIRPFWSPRHRFFFEGSLYLPEGQMYMSERRAMYEAIVAHKPSYCIEIGTWTGGESTFFLASAFEKIGNGKVITSEADHESRMTAIERYKTNLPALTERIVFLDADSLQPFVGYMKGGLEAIFLDGADVGEETKKQYDFFLPHCRPGTILMAHDWESEKMRLVRPAVEADARWRLETYLKPPESIGFVIYIRE